MLTENFKHVRVCHKYVHLFCTVNLPFVLFDWKRGLLTKKTKHCLTVVECSLKAGFLTSTEINLLLYSQRDKPRSESSLSAQAFPAAEAFVSESCLLQTVTNQWWNLSEESRYIFISRDAFHDCKMSIISTEWGRHIRVVKKRRGKKWERARMRREWVEKQSGKYMRRRSRNGRWEK